MIDRIFRKLFEPNYRFCNRREGDCTWWFTQCRPAFSFTWEYVSRSGSVDYKVAVDKFAALCRPKQVPKLNVIWKSKADFQEWVDNK